MGFNRTQKQGGGQEISELPTIESFKELPEEQQKEIVEKWNPYDLNDGHPLSGQIGQEFKKKYGHLRGLEIHGISNCHGGLVIGVSRPLIFDRRLLPDYFLGFPVYETVKDMPEDFAIYKKYIWAPENYEHYVDLHADEIKKELGKPDMSRKEMLSVLCGMDFDKWIEQCRSWGMTDKYK